MGKKLLVGAMVVLTGTLVFWFSVSAEEPPGGRLPNPFGEAPTAPPAAQHATNLGKNVNSYASDIGPVIAPDGNHLFFTSNRKGGLGGQDVWVSLRQNGVWQPAANLGPPINTKGDEGPDSFSLAENALYFTACDRQFGQGGCDIYVSFQQEQGWSEPENLGPPINTKANESNASISSDGDFIVFTSDRTGGLGGADLWLARRGQVIRKLLPGFSTSGRWEEPVNLGPNINTPDWDGVGFLMPDNLTLYFSSRGRGGEGADIFQSVLGHGSWSPARNMGDIVNTARDEIYFTLPGSGDLAYFSSDMGGGLGNEDIYAISIPLLLPSTRLVILKGKVKDESGAPLCARVRVLEAGTSRLISETRSDAASGAFNLVFKADRIQIEVNDDRHRSYQETVELAGSEPMATLTREISLQPK